MATKTFRTVPDTMVSDSVNLFVALVLLLRNSVKWLYFASRHPDRAEIAWKCFLEAQEASGPQKI